MCSIITHSLLGLGIARAGTAQRMPPCYWIAAGILPMLPDLDTPIFRLINRDTYNNPDTIFSHRGITHTVLFAAVAALLAALLVRSSIPRWRVWLILVIATVSHPLTDMLTDGGNGISIFAPFWNKRFVSPWTPVEVSPLSVKAFLGSRGVEILLNEALWVLLPMVGVLAVIESVRYVRRKPA